MTVGGAAVTEQFPEIPPEQQRPEVLVQLAAYDPTLEQRIDEVWAGASPNGQHFNLYDYPVDNHERAQALYGEYGWVLHLGAYAWREKASKEVLLQTAALGLFEAIKTHDPASQPDFLKHLSETVNRSLKDVLGEAPETDLPSADTLEAFIASRREVSARPVGMVALAPAVLQPEAPAEEAVPEETVEEPVMPAESEIPSEFSDLLGDDSDEIEADFDELDAAGADEPEPEPEPQETPKQALRPKRGATEPEPLKPLRAAAEPKTEAKVKVIDEGEPCFPDERTGANLRDGQQVLCLVPLPVGAREPKSWELFYSTVKKATPYEQLYQQGGRIDPNPGFAHITSPEDPVGRYINMNQNIIIPVAAWRLMKLDPAFAEAWLDRGTREDARTRDELHAAIKKRMRDDRFSPPADRTNGAGRARVHGDNGRVMRSQQGARHVRDS